MSLVAPVTGSVCVPEPGYAAAMVMSRNERGGGAWLG